MPNWYMITLVGEDQPAIVAQVTKALFEGKCNLGETSMIRLGGNFTIMMMVNIEADEKHLQSLLEPVANKLSLHLHIDEIKAHLHDHRTPDVRISVFSGDRSGIVAEATTRLTDAGLDILDLESDVGGTPEKPIYIMHIEGIAENGVEEIEQAVADLKKTGLDINLSAIDTIIG